MDQHTSEETQIRIRQFRNAHAKTNALEGMMRIDGLELHHVQEMIRTYLFCQAYAISREQDEDSDGYHFHFVVYNKRRKLKIKPFREHMKSCLSKAVDLKKNLLISEGFEYKNGNLNIGRVEDSFKILAYIVKEQLYGETYTYRIHGLPVDVVQLAFQLSYRKIRNMASKIINLYKQVQLHILTPRQATVSYILMRNQALQPDPYWKKFYLNCEMIALKDEHAIDQMVLQYHLEWNQDSFVTIVE